MSAWSEVAPPTVDIRWMNSVATLIFILAACAALVAAVTLASRLPWFAIKQIEVDGDVARSNAATLRAHVMPALDGGFFGFDIAAGRAAFESVPWVRHAVVRRVWPDRLHVTLEEHRASAQWLGEDGVERLVNEQGDVFDANLGEVEDQAMPLLTGPDGSAARLLGLYRSLSPPMAKIDQRIESLRMSRRGSLRAELAGGASIEFGRGDDAEILARTARFVSTMSQVKSQFDRPLMNADLRHIDAYAVRLKGITTQLPVTAPAGKK